ncbi:MAG: tyrosine-type recombinase/integrase [Mycobacterium sp.]
MLCGVTTRIAADLKVTPLRKMLRRACGRAGLNVRVTPHAFRHKAASDLYAMSDFNAEIVAQEFGWAAADLVPLFADLPDARRAIAEPQRVRRHPRREAAALRTLLLMVLVLGAVLSLAVIQIPLIFLLPVLWIAFARHHFARHHFARRSCRAW